MNYYIPTNYGHTGFSDSWQSPQDEASRLYQTYVVDRQRAAFLGHPTLTAQNNQAENGGVFTNLTDALWTGGQLGLGISTAQAVSTAVQLDKLGHLAKAATNPNGKSLGLLSRGLMAVGDFFTKLAKVGTDAVRFIGGALAKEFPGVARFITEKALPVVTKIAERAGKFLLKHGVKLLGKTAMKWLIGIAAAALTAATGGAAAPLVLAAIGVIFALDTANDIRNAVTT